MRGAEANINLFQIFAFLNRLELWDAVHVFSLLQRGRGMSR